MNSSLSTFDRFTQMPRLFPKMCLLTLVKGVPKSTDANTSGVVSGEATCLTFLGSFAFLGCQSSRNQPGLPCIGGRCPCDDTAITIPNTRHIKPRMYVVSRITDRWLKRWTATRVNPTYSRCRHHPNLRDNSHRQSSNKSHRQRWPLD